MPLWKQNLVFVWWNNFVTAIGMMAFLPLFPFFVREVGIEDEARVRTWSGILVAAAPLAAAMLGPFWGALGDRVGRKWMLLRANAGIVIFVGAMAFATSPWHLLVLRLLQGVFSGFIAPSLTLVSVSAPADRQGRVTSILHTAVLAGSATGPLIGGWIRDHLELRTVFLVCAAMSAVALASTAYFVQEPERTERTELRDLHWRPLFTQVLKQIGALLRPGPLRQVLLAVFLVRIGISLVEPLLGLFVEGLDGVDPELVGTATGAVFAALVVATLLSTPAVGWASDRFAPRAVLATCAVGCTLTYGLQSLATHLHGLLVGRFASGLFTAGIMPAAYTIAARHTPPEQRGSAYGLTFSSFGLANAIGPVIGGLVGAKVGLRSLFWCAAGLMLLASIRVATAPGAEEGGRTWVTDSEGPGPRDP